MGMTAAIGLTVAGGVSTAYGQDQAGRLNQKVLNANAQIADWQADDALARGKTDADKQRSKTRQHIGSQRARLAAQGIDIESGSALDIQLDSAGLGEVDARIIENNGARESWGYRMQATDSRTRGKIARYEAKQQAVGTLLTTGAKSFGYSQGMK